METSIRLETHHRGNLRFLIYSGVIVLINEDGKIMMAAREPLPSLDRVKTFIEVKGDNELNMILNDVIG